MTQSITTGFLFDLAEEIGLPLDADIPEVFEDQAYDHFRQRYLDLAQLRDEALMTHLQNTHGDYRTYAPYNDRVLDLASEVLWYVDELLIRDPIMVILKTYKQENYENNKLSLRNQLHHLSQFKEAIQSGYVLFAGSSVIPTTDEMKDQIQGDLSAIASQPAVVTALDQAVHIGYRQAKNSDGIDFNIFQILLDRGFHIGFHIDPSTPVSEQLAFPPYILGEILPSISVTDLSAIVDDDIQSLARQLYVKEVENTLAHVHRAVNLKATALFDRKCDEAIISAAGSAPDPNSEASVKQIATVGALKLTLPYIENIPRERLMDLRAEMPNAFLDFRSRMVEIMRKGYNEDPEQAEILLTRA